MTKVFVELLNKIKEQDKLIMKLQEQREDKMTDVPFRLVRDGARLPEKHLQATAYDVFLTEDVTIYPWTRGRLIPTGLAANFPAGVAAKTYARSSINKKTCIRVNTGIIDNDYTGEIWINVDNISWWKIYKFKKGDRLAQLEIHSVLPTTVTWTDEAKVTERGEKGFGSSGE